MNRWRTSIIKALTDAGFDTCFANPGASEMQPVSTSDKRRPSHARQT
jgi:thiamine pyrophosphate-dependent acetolactate synthase large subunit-like protein